MTNRAWANGNTGLLFSLQGVNDNQWASNDDRDHLHYSHFNNSWQLVIPLSSLVLPNRSAFSFTLDCCQMSHCCQSITFPHVHESVQDTKGLRISIILPLTYCPSITPHQWTSTMIICIQCTSQPRIAPSITPHQWTSTMIICIQCTSQSLIAPPLPYINEPPQWSSVYSALVSPLLPPPLPHINEPSQWSSVYSALVSPLLPLHYPTSMNLHNDHLYTVH